MNTATLSRPFDNQSQTMEQARRGASMGRPSTPVGFLDPTKEQPKLRLQRVPLSAGGYDPGGAYWGHGVPLFCAWSDDGEFAFYVRALDRAEAKAQLEHREGHACRWAR